MESPPNRSGPPRAVEARISRATRPHGGEVKQHSVWGRILGTIKPKRSSSGREGTGHIGHAVVRFECPICLGRIPTTVRVERQLDRQTARWP